MLIRGRGQCLWRSNRDLRELKRAVQELLACLDLTKFIFMFIICSGITILDPLGQKKVSAVVRLFPVHKHDVCV